MSQLKELAEKVGYKGRYPRSNDELQCLLADHTQNSSGALTSNAVESTEHAPSTKQNTGILEECLSILRNGNLIPCPNSAPLTSFCMAAKYYII